MISMYVIISLATATLAKGSVECNFSVSTRSLECFGAEGQLLLFHLPNTTNTEFKLIKDNKYLILRKVKNQIVTLSEEHAALQSESELLRSGTLNLGNATKRHSGDYTLEEYGSSGNLLKKVNGQLEIQAPVSEPAVSQMCLTREKMKVSCSSEGDEVEFSLRLDDQLLIHIKDHSLTPSNWTANIQSLALSTAKQDKYSVSEVTIGLHGQRTGNLMCKVCNKVSRHETVINLMDCKDGVSSFPFVAVVVRAGVVILLLVALCLGMKKLYNKPRPPTVNECNSEEEDDKGKGKRHEDSTIQHDFTLNY